MRDDRNAIHPFGNSIGLGKSLVGIAHGLSGCLLVIGRRLSAGFRVKRRRSNRLQNGVGRAVRLEHVQIFIARLFDKAIPLDGADHLVGGHLVIEHVVDGIDAQRTFFLRATLGRFGVAD